MSSKRPIILMAILLALVFAYLARPWWDRSYPLHDTSYKPEPPLPGTNTLSGLTVTQHDDGKWYAAFNYFYTGDPVLGYVGVSLAKDEAELQRRQFYSMPSGSKVAERGQHHVEIEIDRPMDFQDVTTHGVSVALTSQGKTLAYQQVTRTIVWPDWQTWAWNKDMGRKSLEMNFQQAVRLIDSENQQSLAEAKYRLERMITQDPKFDRGYIELARVAMKTNWGPEGLHQAENLLLSARQIDPENVNAKILLGYVYAHQGRYKPAETLFIEASKTDTKNLWLWANWGQLLVMQGKVDQAIPKYQEAIKRPRAFDTYDRAKLDAYEKLLVLVERRDDLDQMQALHKQRADEFGPGSCYSADYGRFMLRYRGDAQAAIDLAQRAIKGNCAVQYARTVAGLGYYLAWAQSPETQRDAMLNQARIYLPAGPELVYELASSDKTVVALEKLKANGESIDQRDNENFNALVYALTRKNLAATRRLLALGAQPLALVGADEMPVALYPVLSTDVEAIRLMQRSGVDYTKLRYRGITAIEHARQTGNSRLLEVLDTRGHSL